MYVFLIYHGYSICGHLCYWRLLHGWPCWCLHVHFQDGAGTDNSQDRHSAVLLPCFHERQLSSWLPALFSGDQSFQQLILIHIGQCETCAVVKLVSNPHHICLYAYWFLPLTFKSVQWGWLSWKSLINFNPVFRKNCSRHMCFIELCYCYSTSLTKTSVCINFWHSTGVLWIDLLWWKSMTDFSLVLWKKCSSVADVDVLLNYLLFFNISNPDTDVPVNRVKEWEWSMDLPLAWVCCLTEALPPGIQLTKTSKMCVLKLLPSARWVLSLDLHYIKDVCGQGVSFRRASSPVPWPALHQGRVCSSRFLCRVSSPVPWPALHQGCVWSSFLLAVLWSTWHQGCVWSSCLLLQGEESCTSTFSASKTYIQVKLLPFPGWMVLFKKFFFTFKIWRMRVL